MKQLISFLDRPLVTSPVRRRWASVALYLAALWAWALFAYTTYVFANQPRGAAVPYQRMAWTEGEWRFKTHGRGEGGEEQHSLVNYKAGLELTLCDGPLQACHKQLFPRDGACWSVAQSETSLQAKQFEAMATCSQLLGKHRYNGRYWVGHYGGQVGVAVRIAGDGDAEYIFQQAIIRPDPSQREDVLLAILMTALSIGALFLWLRYGVARLAWTWRDSWEDDQLLKGIHERAERWRAEE